MKRPFSAPKKNLGQNFLQDQNIICNIVSSLGDNKKEHVVEIGPGRGALTEHLIAQCQQLHVVELDRELANYWQQRAQTLDNLTVHKSDVLQFDFGQFTNVKVVGNLPYQISSQILFHLMRYVQQIEVIIVMLQLEVVQRMCAQPHNKLYGRLSVMLQQQYEIRQLFKVPASAFYPKPKVESDVVRLFPKRNIEPINSVRFAEIVKQAFSQRRKTLRNTLKPLFTSQQIESADINPNARAETLTVDDFVKLSKICCG